MTPSFLSRSERQGPVNATSPGRIGDIVEIGVETDTDQTALRPMTLNHQLEVPNHPFLLS